MKFVAVLDGHSVGCYDLSEFVFWEFEVHE